MTTALPFQSSISRPWPTLRALSWPDRLVFAAGALAWLHLLDAATWHAQRNAGPVERTVHLFLALAAGPAFAWGYLKASRTWKAAIPAVAGIPLLGTGIAIHLVGTVKNGFGSGDATGIAVAFAGLALVLVGAVRLVGLPRRWRYRIALMPLGLPALLYVLLPSTMVIFITHAPRYEITAQDLGADYEEVEFETSDGLTIRGWYIPSKNGAAVAVMHGSSGARIRPLLHIQMLQANGYGVLAYDTRGHGESDGTTNALGWGAEKDAMAALEFLEAREDVGPGRVGLLGLSMGAEIALEMATKSDAAAAIVADGAGVRSVRELNSMEGSWSKYLTWPTVAGMSVGTAALTGELPPAALISSVDDINSPVLYISGNIGEERELNRMWAAKTARSEHWEADAGHTGGLKTHPEAYESRVIGWFDAHLLQQGR
jgi:pimeloyl-ACP methyl ester carboxylesterase